MQSSAYTPLNRGIYVAKLCKTRFVCPLDRRLQQTAEFACEFDRYARVHPALAVEEALRSAQAEHTLVPDVRMDIKPLKSVESETDEAQRSEIIAGQRERHIERTSIDGKK